MVLNESRRICLRLLTLFSDSASSRIRLQNYNLGASTASNSESACSPVEDLAEPFILRQAAIPGRKGREGRTMEAMTTGAGSARWHEIFMRPWCSYCDSHRRAVSKRREVQPVHSISSSPFPPRPASLRATSLCHQMISSHGKRCSTFVDLLDVRDGERRDAKPVHGAAGDAQFSIQARKHSSTCVSGSRELKSQSD